MSEPVAPVAAPAPLAYAVRSYAEPRVTLFRIAHACWAVPLMVGLVILVLYAITGAGPLPMMGFLTILFGLVLLGVGVVCLAVFELLLRECEPSVRQSWSVRVRDMFLQLLSNIPVAAACAAVGFWLMHQLRQFGL